MSEEEKKAIKRIKKLLTRKPDYDKGIWLIEQDVSLLLNLIEKQSKEIEELKENNKQKYYHVVKSNELEEEINNAWENKIKAKIEAYEEILRSPIIKEDYKKEVEHIIRVLKDLRGEN